MATAGKTTSFNTPAPYGVASGSAPLFLFSPVDEDGSALASGQGVTDAVMPLFTSARQDVEAQLPLVTDGYETMTWGTMGISYAYNQLTWIQHSPTNATGFLKHTIDMAISGVSRKTSFGLMPMNISVLATGYASGNMSLYTINQQVSTGAINMAMPYSHQQHESNAPLYTKGTYRSYSSSLNLVATGLGFSQSSVKLYTFGGEPSGGFG